MSKYKKPEQKLISFTEGSNDMQQVVKDMQEGWSITSLVRNGVYFVGIMEKKNANAENTDSIFIPPRKKIKIFSSK